ncbi:MAG: hypothetical protein OXC63_03120 [Aestuariivita sp.]|nr:hypothetical protein [Aestuariivita sp.]MCY4346053.1 hypothetical protein [Aestuariivita sp.]
MLTDYGGGNAPCFQSVFGGVLNFETLGSSRFSSVLLTAFLGVATEMAGISAKSSGELKSLKIRLAAWAQ